MKERLTLLFLVLLRMAIGWHFGFEAAEKIRQNNIGESVLLGKPALGEVGKPWTSEGYFREGVGPLAQLVKSRIGDTDDLLIAKLTPRVGPDDAPQLSEELERDWEDRVQRFVNHHGLDPDRQRLVLAAFEEEKARTVAWLTSTRGDVRWLLAGLWTSDRERPAFKRSFPTGTYDVNISIAERAEEHRGLVEEYRAIGERLFPLGKDVERTRRPAVRAEVAAMRAELQKLLDDRTAEMMKSVADAADLDPDQAKARGPVPPPERHWLIKSIDLATMWGLLAIGICLLLGLFSRTAALGGAIFLIMTLLTHPPLPWLPVPPNSEGNYVFISKNVIELFALLLLACIPTGRWFGLDALIDALNPWKKKEAA